MAAAYITSDSNNAESITPDIPHSFSLRHNDFMSMLHNNSVHNVQNFSHGPFTMPIDTNNNIWCREGFEARIQVLLRFEVSADLEFGGNSAPGLLASHQCHVLDSQLPS